jgi:hypothetical protein
MKFNIFKNALLALAISASFFACKKSNTDLAPVENYLLLGKIDASRTTIPGVVLNQATFTVSFNNPNSFGDAQSIFDGSLKLFGYTGITGRDTCAFFATQTSGPAISYITAASASTGINSASNNNFYNYFNGPSLVFNATKYPFTNDITNSIKQGKGYFRIGQFPKYVFVVLDDVTKL